MHAKSDSEVTSLAASSPARSPRRPVYYVMSPSHHDPAEKPTSLASTPATSPYHHYHSRDSSATRFSASFKHTATTTSATGGPLKKLAQGKFTAADEAEEEEEEEEEDDERKIDPRCYFVWFFLGFVLLFSFFSLILWTASKAYPPRVFIKKMVFESFNIQAGIDETGVPTKMLSLNSTLRISFLNPATFFGVHVSSTLLELHYYDLQIAAGKMAEFYQSRRSGRTVAVAVGGEMVPLYGGGADGEPAGDVPVRLTFVVRSRAYILGRLVRSKFYTRVKCVVEFRETMVGKRVDVKDSCRYRS